MIAIIRNANSGTAPDVEQLELALATAGVTADVLNAPSGAAFGEWIAERAAQYDVLAAAGGDGTVSTVAAAAAKAGKTLAVIPAGTLNHYARDAGIPTELDQALAVIAGGVTRLVDIGTVNGRYFLNNVSLGNYPLMVEARAVLERRGRSRRVAAVMASATTWWRLRNVAARLDVDGRALLRRSPFIVVSNGEYVVSGLSLGSREELAGGALTLYIAPRSGRLGVLSLPVRALAGTLEAHEQFEILRATRITGDLGRHPVHVAIDGEAQVLTSPLEFTIHARALRLMVPKAIEP